MFTSPLISNHTRFDGRGFNSGMDSMLENIMYIYMLVLISFIVLQLLFAGLLIIKHKTIFRSLLGVLSGIFMLASIPFFLPSAPYTIFGVIVVIFGGIGLYISITFTKK
ncbi:MAG: hypothetical protein HRT57_00140 [Crocinitomicaceae bacterium]|nr:hypothetical protein [Crocinitomicaceae bacterium]